MISLSSHIVQTEIEDMIWEVDEDCDQGLNWSEFQAMYHRCNNDKTGWQQAPALVVYGYRFRNGQLIKCSTLCAGYEPRRLFNVVQFVMNDKEGSGNVSLEGAMQILYLRYGRGLLDAQLEEIFGTSDLNSGMCLSQVIATKCHSLSANKSCSQVVILSDSKVPDW